MVSRSDFADQMILENAGLNYTSRLSLYSTQSMVQPTSCMAAYGLLLF